MPEYMCKQAFDIDQLINHRYTNIEYPADVSVLSNLQGNKRSCEKAFDDFGLLPRSLLVIGMYQNYKKEKLELNHSSN